jgi:hypothetical protein
MQCTERIPLFRQAVNTTRSHTSLVDPLQTAVSDPGVLRELKPHPLLYIGETQCWQPTLGCGAAPVNSVCALGLGHVRQGASPFGLAAT